MNAVQAVLTEEAIKCQSPWYSILIARDMIHQQIVFIYGFVYKIRNSCDSTMWSSSLILAYTIGKSWEETCRGFCVKGHKYLCAVVVCRIEVFHFPAGEFTFRAGKV